MIKSFSINILYIYRLCINNMEVELSLHEGDNFVLDQNQ